MVRILVDTKVLKATMKVKVTVSCSILPVIVQKGNFDEGNKWKQLAIRIIIFSSR